MRRGTLVLDRVWLTLTGLVVAALGVLALLWWFGQLPGLGDPLQVSRASTLVSWSQQSWFPWALGALGVALTVLGMVWLVAHVPNRSVGRLNLTGSSSTGTLSVAASAVADAAAESLAQTPGVRRAKGRVHSERGELVAKIDATIEPFADLPVIAKAADRVSAEVADGTGRTDLTCQVNLRVARSDGHRDRVV